MVKSTLKRVLLSRGLHLWCSIRHAGCPDTWFLTPGTSAEESITIGKKLADEIGQTGDSSPYAHLKRADTQFKFEPVTADQIQQTISKLIISKATGIHNIPNKS